ncbi:MAG: HNH endonuclease [Candidatus Thermoplasmatota archaeon]|nr:HNH endonuclease [Candidatus Thermoplasmatota archaeon]
MNIPNLYSEIPRLTLSELHAAERIAGIEHVYDFLPTGDSGKSLLPWAKMSRAVLARDSYSCRICGKSSLKTFTSSGNSKNVHLDVQVHHITPRKDSGSDSFLNLITLCESCHHKTFKNGYAGLPPVERSLEDFTKRMSFVVPEDYAIKSQGCTRCRLIDHARSFMPASGAYEIIEMEGSVLDVPSVSIELSEINEFSKYFEREYGAKSYISVRAIGTRTGLQRIFIDSEGKPVL